MRRTIVLFEGASDRLAFEAMARRIEAEWDPQEVVLVDMNGVTNLRRHLAELRASPDRPRVLGLYDAAEADYVAGVLRDSGMLLAAASDPRPSAVVTRDVGFFGCERDLEDEVIAAAGPEGVLAALEARGELARFRVFQGQPAQRPRSIEAQLHRFAGTAAGRKARFAADVIEALPVERMPRPLLALLDAALRPA